MPERKRRKPIGPEADAKGQSEMNHKGGSNDGVSSADPRVISGNEEGDATWPLDQDSPNGRQVKYPARKDG